MILAGDIGATKTHLALFEGEKIAVEERFRSHDFKTLSQIIYQFLEKHRQKVKRACFGIAGPVEEGRCHATNLPWIVNAKEIEKDLQIEKVVLLNDLEATAFGLESLKPDELIVLNAGKEQHGLGALIAAGTGLGEVGLFWDGKQLKPFPSEGGHTDFAPRTEDDVQLWHFLRARFEHVSYERLVSGPGIYTLYQFLIESGKEKENPEIKARLLKEDPPKVITDGALQKSCKACIRTLDWFIALYGAEAGNLALKFLALKGVYVGGGIAPKILPLFKKEIFLHAFCDKGRFAALLSKIPIRLILNEHTALLGAGAYLSKKRELL
ncbi:MAG: glucokinase [Chlamydiales bacterium]